MSGTGLSALAAFGDSLFSSAVPHPNDLFAGLYGTYAADPIFSNQGTLSALASPTFRFKPLSLTISPVPEPSSLAMALLGALLVLGFGARSGRGRRHITLRG